MKRLLCFLVLLLLCSCTPEQEYSMGEIFPKEESAALSDESEIPLCGTDLNSGLSASETFPIESSLTETEVKPESEPAPGENLTETDAVHYETEFITETEPVPETVPTVETKPPTETVETPVEESAPILLPFDLHTNIENPDALLILSDIYEELSSSQDASVYFIDTEEEYYFGINEDKMYHTASTIKPVYCQYLLASGIDLNTEVTLRYVTRSSSSGKLNADSVGESFTVGELMEYSVRYSDNQAHRLLYDTFGIAGYNSYVSRLGGMYLGDQWEWPNASPRMLSRGMLEIYRYGDQNSFLIENLKNTTFNKQIADGTKYITAHKYGSNGGTKGYHDTAIVYAPERAYILTIMTHIDTSSDGDTNAVFRRVAELCDQLHEALFLD